MMIPKEKAIELEEAYKQIAKVEQAVPQRCHHRRRALQQGHRHLDARYGRRLANALFRTLEFNDGKPECNPRVHDGGLRRPW